MKKKNKKKKVLPYYDMPGLKLREFNLVNGIRKQSNDGREITVSEIEHRKDILFISCAKEHSDGNVYELKFIISNDGARQLWDMLGDKLFGGR